MESVNKYLCSVPVAPGVPARVIEAPTSFEARRRFAAGHTAMNAGDVIAVRQR